MRMTLPSLFRRIAFNSIVLTRLPPRSLFMLDSRRPTPSSRRECQENDLASGGKPTRRLALLAGPALVVLITDQVSKDLVRRGLQHGRVIDLLGGLVRLDFTRNSGAAFGMFRAGGLVFAAIALLVAAGIVLSYQRVARSAALVRLGLGFIAGGAIGNLLDRVRFGYVVDFVDLRWWYVFNVADSAIVAGVGLLVLHSIWNGSDRQ